MLRTEIPKPSIARAGKFQGRLPIGLFVFFFAVYLLVTSARLSSVDDKIMFDVTRSILSTGSFASSEPLSERESYTEPWFYVEGKDGKAYGKYGLGQSLAILPLFALGRAVLPVLPPSYVDWFPADYIPFKSPERISFAERAENSVIPAFTALLNPAATALSCVLIFLIARHLGAATGSSLAVAGIFGFATAAFPYAKYSFQHPLVTTLILASFFFLLNCQTGESKWRLLAAGMCLGFASLVRYEAIVSFGVLLVYAWWGSFRERRFEVGATGVEVGPRSQRKRLWASAIQPWKAALSLIPFVLPVLLCGLVVLWFNHLRFGSLLSTGYFQEGFTADLGQSINGLILSPGRSIFLFSPPALLGLLCLPAFARRFLPEGITLAALIVFNFALDAKWSGWEGGWAWGSRYPLPMLPFLIVPLVVALQARQFWPKALLLGFVLLSLPIQILGVVTNFNDFYMERTIIQGMEFWPTVFDWEKSPVPGHVDLLARGVIDLWFLHLIRDGAPRGLQALALIPIGLLALSGLLLRQGLERVGNGD